MLNLKSQVAIKNEGTPGTAETLVAADVILAFDPKFTPKIEMNERNPAMSDLGREVSVAGSRQAEISFSVELVGTAAEGTASHYSDAMKACGMSETIVSATSVTYLPDSDSADTATIAIYKDGKKSLIWGARGNVKFSLEAGKVVMMQFTFTGIDYSITDGAMLTGMTYESTLPPIFQNASLTVGGYAATVAKVEIDLGNKVGLRPDANASSGFKLTNISDRDPTMSLDPEEVLVATEDFWGKWKAGTTVAYSSVIGSVAGNTITITAPIVQYQEVSEGDRNGQVTLEINARLCRNIGDDQLSIAIT